MQSVQSVPTTARGRLQNLKPTPLAGDSVATRGRFDDPFNTARDIVLGGSDTAYGLADEILGCLADPGRDIAPPEARRHAGGAWLTLRRSRSGGR